MPTTRTRYQIKYLPMQYLGKYVRNWQLASDEIHHSWEEAREAIRDMRPAWEAEHGPTLFRVSRTEA